MRRLLIPSLCVLLVVALAPLASGDDQKTSGEAKRINDATSVLAEFSNMSEGAPASLTQNAAGVVVIPGLLKAGFMVGGKHGSGVLSIKNSDGTWSEPVFVKLTGGSIGWQIGVSSTDLVLFFMREKNIRSILDGEFTVGADATVAAGPVGRTGSADTSAKLDAEIYSYSRSRGAFAGISIDGSKIYVDKSANTAYYGEKADPHSIAESKGETGSPGEKFRAALQAFSRPHADSSN